MTSARPVTIAEALERASQALRGNRAEEAERLAAYVLKSNRGHPLAAKLLGQALLVQGRVAEAIEPLRRSARRQPDGETETLLARALASAGDAPAAVEALRGAVERRPAFPLAFLELGELLGGLGRSDEAAATFEQGLALFPDAAVLTVGLGYLRLARQESAEARRLFEGLVAAAPGRSDAALGLAHALAQGGEHTRAAGLYRQRLQARPDEAATWISLATCLLELGDRTGGEAALAAAVRGGAEHVWPAISALCAAPRGRLFLKPSRAVAFLRDPSGASI